MPLLILSPGILRLFTQNHIIIHIFQGFTQKFWHACFSSIYLVSCKKINSNPADSHFITDKTYPVVLHISHSLPALNVPNILVANMTEKEIHSRQLQTIFFFFLSILKIYGPFV